MVRQAVPPAATPSKRLACLEAFLITSKQKIEFVLCRGPFANTDRVYFYIEVQPSTILKGHSVFGFVSGSAFPHTFPPHELAWAASYRLIELCANPDLLKDLLRDVLPGNEPISVSLIQAGRGKATDEIEDYLREAQENTSAFQVARCPKCSLVLHLPDNQLKADQQPRYEETFSVAITCDACAYSFQRAGGDLLFCVKPGPGPLERAIQGA